MYIRSCRLQVQYKDESCAQNMVNVENKLTGTGRRTASTLARAPGDRQIAPKILKDRHHNHEGENNIREQH